MTQPATIFTFLDEWSSFEHTPEDKALDTAHVKALGWQPGAFRNLSERRRAEIRRQVFGAAKYSERKLKKLTKRGKTLRRLYVRYVEARVLNT